MVLHPLPSTSDKRDSSTTCRDQRNKNRWYCPTEVSDAKPAGTAVTGEEKETDRNRNTTMSLSGLAYQHNKVQLTQPCIIVSTEADALLDGVAVSTRVVHKPRSVDPGGTSTAIGPTISPRRISAKQDAHGPIV